MTSARHRRLAPPPPRRDARRLGAVLVLCGVAGLGAVAGPVSGTEQPGPARSTAGDVTGAVALSGARGEARRAAADRVSRSQDRREQDRREQDRREPVAAGEDAAAADVVSPLVVPRSTPAFAQDDTAVVAEPAAGASVLADVERGAQVALSGRTENGFAEVVRDGVLAWVDADLVGPQAPPEEVVRAAAPAAAAAPAEVSQDAPAGLSSSPCPGGSSVESGLTSNTVAVHRAVCAAFPGLVHGGLRPGDSGEHGSGRGLDIMVTGSKGDQIAAFLQQHASELGIDNLIWEQRIWFVGRPHGSWRGMEDRGSVTANHLDHVHVGTR